MDWGIVGSVMVAMALFTVAAGILAFHDDRPVCLAHEEACRQQGWQGL